MIQRRHFLVLAAALAPLSARAQAPGAQDAGAATAFVKTAGDKLVAVVNGSGDAAGKRAARTGIIDQAVDVDGVGKFCLGRYWRTASPDQQARYLRQFHQVLVTNITSKLGEYRGVTFQIGKTATRDDGIVVSTTVNRPNNPPTIVDWVIQTVEGGIKIVDVVAEGTSLRLTQRSDYAAYMTQHKGDVDALIGAMTSQMSQGG
jgi:phospholipid transport system substrate-binding protein